MAVRVVLAVTAALAAGVAAAPDARAANLGGCQMFPSAGGSNAGTNADWNLDVSGAPVDSRSGAYVGSIGAGANLHPDFGSNPDYGIPFTIVPADQPLMKIRFTAYGDESDPGPYPIPKRAPIEAGSDHHVLVLQRERCRIYELFGARRHRRYWSAASGAVFDLTTGARRPEGWTSADAAGLPILPGLVRYDEVRSGTIDHAIRFTAPRTQRAYLHPATHFASSSTDPSLPPMGLRMRLKPSFSLSGFHGDALVILSALKRYGMILADNGSSWFITGATDSRWDDDDLAQLKRVPGSAFEAVNTGQSLRTG